MHGRITRKQIQAMSARGRMMARARWATDRKRRDAEEPERLQEMELIESLNLPRHQGDAVGVLQWTDLASGQVRRWTVRIGDRIDRFTVHAPDGTATGSHGLTWIFNRLRSKVVGMAMK